MRNLILTPLFICVLLVPCSLYAADNPSTQVNSSHNETLDSYAPDSVYFSLGDLKTDEAVNELQNPRADFGLDLGIEYIYNDYLAFRYEMLVVDRRYDTPATVSGGPFTVVSDDMSMSSLGISVLPIVRYAVSDFEFYAGAGLGIFWSKLTLTASTFGLPGSHEERSQDYATQTLLGMGYNFQESFIGLEARQLDLKVNMSPVTSAADHDAGGKILLLVYRIQL